MCIYIQVEFELKHKKKRINNGEYRSNPKRTTS